MEKVFISREKRRLLWKSRRLCVRYMIDIGSYPILLIFFSFSSSMILIFLPSMVISFSVAKLESVRIAFEVVIFDKFAKSSRER